MGITCFYLLTQLTADQFVRDNVIIKKISQSFGQNLKKSYGAGLMRCDSDPVCTRFSVRAAAAAVWTQTAKQQKVNPSTIRFIRESRFFVVLQSCRNGARASGKKRALPVIAVRESQASKPGLRTALNKPLAKGGNC